ncbi:MAG: asparagine synthase (glutamine-hydrolyzing) [Desulfomonile tiedjei]|nr:asparagine synthase (glutamine-hydrolyzing) [Desulfomonile tiedjei]
MCGICGIVDFSEKPFSGTVEAMTSSLKHRGPDMGGTHAFPACVFGFRRLSIIDLSVSAGQPMLSQDGTTAVVFNGEIYNFREIRKFLESKGHRFRTQSDTEVLLELYLQKKEAMLDDLNGMFSFAIWDDREKRLFLARDRLGKKPLYYTHAKDRVSFSSELYSLLRDPAVPRDLNNQAVFEYLLYDFIPAPDSIFKGVFKLPAAHAAIFDAGGFRVWRYWEPPFPEESNDYPSQRSALLDLLQDAVRLRLISDVPLGSFLSGGLDSTLITALMRENVSNRVRTFSISFPGTSHDESKWSRLAAEALATDHSEQPVDYGVEDLLPKMVRHFGEPFGDSSAIPTWRLCEMTRQHVTVALSGDGGDELFGGYERYLARRVQLIYDLLPTALRRKVIEPLVRSLPATTDYYGTSAAKKLLLFVEASGRIRDNPLAVVPRTFSVPQVAGLTGLHYQADLDPVISAARQWMGLDPVSRMMLTDLQTYLAEDILTKVDRMSMAHALEVRSPLLDYRVVELAGRMPLRFKIRGVGTKRILRDAAQGRVPAEILGRSKYGFQIPLGSWFKGRLKSWGEQRLMESTHGLFDKKGVEDLWKEHQLGRADHTHRLWLLIFFNEWHEQFRQETGVISRTG